MNNWLNQYLTFIHILSNLHGHGTPSTSTPDILRTYRNPSSFLPSFLRRFYRSYKCSLSIIKTLSVIPHGSGTLQTWSGHSRTNDQQRDLDGHVTPMHSTKIFHCLNRGRSCLIPFVSQYLHCLRSDQWHHHVMFNLVNEQCYLTRSDKWYTCDQITGCAAIGYNFSWVGP